MKINRQVSISAVVGFVAANIFAVSVPGWTQSRGGTAAVRTGVGRVVGGHPGSHPAGRIGTALNPNFAPIRGVPGNGFDYQHLVAVGTSSEPRRGTARRAGRSFVTPIFGAGLPYYYAFDSGYPYDTEVPNEQAPSAPLVPASPDQSEPPYAEAQSPLPPTQAPIPPPELGELILVRRDGQVVMAVAFTTSNGRLTYITQDGLRRSFPIAELDADATRQMNSVNGTSVAIPN